MPDVIFLVLLIIHIGTIVAWLGGGILFTSVIGPTLQRIQPSTRADFLSNAIPRYVRFILGSAIAAIVAGVLLFGYITQQATSLAPSQSGIVYLEAGALLGLIAFILGIVVVYPAGMKLSSALRTSQPNEAPSTKSTQVAAASAIPMSLMKRLRAGASAATGLLAITLILMIIGTLI